MNKAGMSAGISLLAGLGGLAALLLGHRIEAAALHIAAGYIGHYAAIKSDQRRLGSHYFQLALAFGLPFFGAWMAYFLSEAVKSKNSGSLASEFAVYLNDAATFRESVAITDGEAPASEDIMSLADILAYPVSEDEQRIAVENLASMETPEAMDILRQVIESDSGEGRFFAMTAIGQMEEKLLGKLQDLEEILESGRDDSSVAHLEAARTYMDFFYYQLAVDARRQDFLIRARDLLDAALAKPDCDPDAWILRGRVELLSYNGAEALRCFNTYLNKNPHSIKALLWRAEALFMQGDLQAVVADCREVMAMREIPETMRNLARFWLEGCAKEDTRIIPSARR